MQARASILYHKHTLLVAAGDGPEASSTGMKLRIQATPPVFTAHHRVYPGVGAVVVSHPQLEGSAVQGEEDDKDKKNNKKRPRRQMFKRSLSSAPGRSPATVNESQRAIPSIQRRWELPGSALLGTRSQPED